VSLKCLRTEREYLVSELPDSADRDHPIEPSVHSATNGTQLHIPVREM
jgi:hypothetical protein